MKIEQLILELEDLTEYIGQELGSDETTTISANKVDYKILKETIEKLKAIDVLKEDLLPASEISPQENITNELYHKKTFVKIEGPLKVYLISESDLIDLQRILEGWLDYLYGDNPKVITWGVERLLETIKERLGE